MRKQRAYCWHCPLKSISDWSTNTKKREKRSEIVILIPSENRCVRDAIRGSPRNRTTSLVSIWESRIYWNQTPARWNVERRKSLGSALYVEGGKPTWREGVTYVVNPFSFPFPVSPSNSFPLRRSALFSCCSKTYKPRNFLSLGSVEIKAALLQIPNWIF